MADEEKHEGEEFPEEESGSSGLGNLPPLSDFDSQDNMDSGGGLPPLGSFESDKDEEDDSGGLPPISDIEVETPEPAGGNIRRAPVGFDSGFEANTPTMDTPAPSSRFMRSPGSFQDLGADSDFSPETPEVGPGPSSGIDTPTFDTAFGGGGFQSPTKTPLPTQAMETPMFGGPSAPGGFDPGAFGGDFGGTPAPDFGPDTGIGRGASPQPVMMAPEPRGGGIGVAALVIAIVVSLVAGVFGGPFVADQAFMAWMPNPTRTELVAVEQQAAMKDGTISQLRQQIADLQDFTEQTRGETPVTQEELDRLRGEIITAQNELAQVQQSLQSAQTNLASVEQDLQQKSEEVFQAQERFTTLETATKITQARRDGLEAEANRLTDLVGTLDDAAVRSNASKEALQHSVELLLAELRKGMPLTPEKFSHAARVARVEALRNQITEAKWVTPALMNAFNDAVQNEIAVANASEYFFAKLAVIDRYGTRVEKWAECLMNGNWSVYYRTLDGKNIGVYENLASAGELPLWGLNEGLPKEAQEAIEARVVNARVPDFQEKIEFLAAKQMAELGETNFQRSFDSL